MPLAQAGRDLRRAVVHIGQEIEKLFETSGLTKKAFAEKIGRGHNKINDVFESPSCDTRLLAKIGEVLHFDFFTFYQQAPLKPYSEALPPASVVSDGPAAPIKPPPIQLVVNLDPGDEELEKKVRQLVKILGGK